MYDIFDVFIYMFKYIDYLLTRSFMVSPDPELTVADSPSDVIVSHRILLYSDGSSDWVLFALYCPLLVKSSGGRESHSTATLMTLHCTSEHTLPLRSFIMMS